jgi:hypothetical protein
MEEAEAKPPLRRKKLIPRKAAEADRRVELWESLREVEVAIPEP